MGSPRSLTPPILVAQPPTMPATISYTGHMVSNLPRVVVEWGRNTHVSLKAAVVGLRWSRKIGQVAKVYSTERGRDTQ